MDDSLVLKNALLKAKDENVSHLKPQIMLTSHFIMTLTSKTHWPDKNYSIRLIFRDSIELSITAEII